MKAEDLVEITFGPFAGNTGQVMEVAGDRVLVTILGLQVELDSDMVQFQDHGTSRKLARGYGGGGARAAGKLCKMS